VELGESTLRKAARCGRFTEDEIRKSEKTWLVTYAGMERLYGERAGKGNLKKSFKKVLTCIANVISCI